MFRSSICAALSLLAAGPASFLLAQNPALPAPPAWRDGASVYLSMGQNAPAEIEPSKDAAPIRDAPSRTPLAAHQSASFPAPQQPAALSAAVQPAPTSPAPFVDSSVRHAFRQTDTAAKQADNHRRLAPSRVDRRASVVGDDDANSLGPKFRNIEIPWKSASTTLAALAVVIGSFLICAWLFRRGMRNTTAALPRDVVTVLGRVPLAARNVAQLLRVGNKLVLISLTPAGAETLTEVTDPAEVDRLVGMCQQSTPHSTTKAFEHVIRQLAREPGPEAFLGQEAPFGPQTPAFETRRAYRGDAVRG